MDILSEIVSLLPTILTAVSAIAAASIAYFNFRSRPILIRTLERHSDDLKALATNWKDELPTFPWLEQGLFPDLSFPLSVEAEFLFQDIWEHVPSDLNLSGTWDEFRQIAEAHHKARAEHLRLIAEKIQSLTDLSQVNTLGKPGYSPDLVRFLFCDTFEFLKRGGLPYTGMNLSRTPVGDLLWLIAGSYGIAAGSAEQLDRVGKTWNEFVKDTVKSDATLMDAAVALVAQESTFRVTRENLVKQINEFIAIPIYSKKCKYVRSSEASRRFRMRVSYRASA